MRIISYMDPTLNPYAPGSGLRPPAMVGRDAQVEAFDTLIARAGNSLHNRGVVLSGLRGVGKTVLLNELRGQATRHEWLTVAVEASPSETGKEALRARFARELLNAARSLGGVGLRRRMSTAAGSIGSFTATIGVSGVSVGITPRAGRADTGRLEVDLEEMVEDVVAALPAGRGFVVFIDEMQDVDDELLSALLTVQHAAGQRGWQFYIVGAGLPNLPAKLSEIRSYAERLFDYSEIGPLAPDAAREALCAPARKLGALFEDDALAALVGVSRGYPYFLQEYGKAVWDLAPTKLFTAQDADLAIQVGLAQLDAGFFPARWTRATPAERNYLSAMAKDGESGSGTGVIAGRLGKKLTSLGPVRANLIAKGLVYAPEHGQIAFTVPGMADYIRRQRAD